MDERFRMHRLYSTRFALIVLLLGILAVFQYQYFKHHVIRWELFWLLVATAIAKLSAMIWFRIKN